MPVTADRTRARPATRPAIEVDDVAEQVPERPVREWFSRAANVVGHAAGLPWAFAGAVLLILVWAITGPIFGFSDTWQLVINTGTTIITFLMVFLIQSTQNKDTAVIHLKLNELIASQRGASNYLIDLEDMTEADLERLKIAFRILAEKAHEKQARGVTTVEEVAHQIVHPGPPHDHNS